MVIIFDVMGTLLDTSAVTPVVRRVTNGKVSAKQFMHHVITYAMATSLTAEHAPFEVIAGSVLEMCAAAYGNSASNEDLRKLNKRLRSLPPFPDVKPALLRLHERGLRLVVLSNAGPEMLDEQLRRARLRKFFEQVLSVDTTGRFKPTLQVYRDAVNRLGGGPHEALMVAAHPWDLLGAARAGLRTALIRRPGVAAYPGGLEPSYSAGDLGEFADQVSGTVRERAGKSHPWLLAGCGVALGLAGAVLGGSPRPKSEEVLRAKAATATH
jgi:2-haloacid dehalogenase